MALEMADVSAEEMEVIDAVWAERIKRRKQHQNLMEACRDEPDAPDTFAARPQINNVMSFLQGKSWLPTPQSSNVAAGAYNPEYKTLTLVFNNGAMYIYYDIPATMAKSFAYAPSKGKWVWNQLRVPGKGNEQKMRKAYRILRYPAS